MKGIKYLVDESGKKVAVQIDLRTHAKLWEDFYDGMIAQSRADEPRVSFEEVKQSLARQTKYGLCRDRE